LDGIFGAHTWKHPRSADRVRRLARTRARTRLAEPGGSELSLVALRRAAGELLVAFADELAADPPGLRAMVTQILEALEISSDELALDVLRAPELLELAPAVAVSAELSFLAAFTGAKHISLWTRDAAARVSCASVVGAAEPTCAARAVAEELLDPERSPSTGRLLVGVPIRQPSNPLAALVASVPAGSRGRAGRLMEDAAALLAAVLERDALLTSSAESERSLTEASERKLKRLGFDLHDGPLQDVAVLAEDMRLLRSQVDQVLAGPRARELVKGRFEDVEAQLVAVDDQLRRVAGEVNAASILLSRPFEQALHDRVQSFVARAGIEPRVQLTGPADLLTSSRQIALLNIVHECLSNIREHAGASVVEINVAVSDDGVEASIRDNGRGFDLEATLVRAAREGRVGLLGIHERVRLLGGLCRIQSRPGGPTTVVVKLGPYRPLTAGRERSSG
jgi:signal transduction histidine kinase